MAGNGFEVDVEGASQSIVELQDAHDELVAIKDEARALARIEPPSRDQVSLDAANVLGAVAGSEKNSFITALDAGILQIESTIAALRASLEAYRDGDAAEAGRLS